MAKVISYAQLTNMLEKLGAQLNAAEAHGLMAGLLSFTNTIPEQNKEWRNILLENLDCKEPSKRQYEMLTSVGESVLQDFASQDFAFRMLLPTDDLPLSERVNALCFWCRGYLSGLGLVGVTEADLANEVVKELVQDLSHIAHVSIDTDTAEDDEKNFMELVEYVRVAVQNIHLELNDIEQTRMLH